MAEPTIHVEKLGKQYRLGAKRERYPTLREQLVKALTAPARRLQSLLRDGSTHGSADNFWALRNVSCEIERGDVVGIIGRNGAGKTTLLKILSRITEPTTGRARIRGKVASLLEVGTGFHPELTGRGNIYLNGAILGMKRAEIDSRFDSIVAFAENDRFIDTQVKHYSSGMYLRLAFAVAAHLDPEILLVDEVLAVGDAAFQKKCLGKMSEVAQAGRTVLFVSHNMEAVQRLCRRCLWIDRGTIVEDGEPDAVIADYLARSTEHLSPTYRYPATSDGEPKERACLLEAEILNAVDQPCEHLRFAEPFSIRMLWQNRTQIPGAFYFIRAFDNQGRMLFTVNHLGADLDIEAEGLQEVTCHFPNSVLIPGEYSLSLGCFMMPKTFVHLADKCLGLVVIDVPYGDSLLCAPRNAIFAPQSRWQVETRSPV